ncbi:hypothetical protein KBA73_01885 [Patescibacteria group bacterium]|nr:hypothetical protein [Patescibacteria group bacterium]
MNRARSFSLLAPLCLLALLGAGCFGTTSKTATGPDGGIFVTNDLGTKWGQLTLLNLDTKLGSIADVGSVSATFDPQDPATFYVGTTQNGLMYSLNSGQSWQLSRGLSIGKVNAVAVDAKNKCIVYAARANQINKTTSCGREWNEVYAHAKSDVLITSLISDWFKPEIVYAGTSQGDILRSDDGAAHWRVINRVDGARINNIVLDPHDSRAIYVATQGAGVLKSVDGGANWMGYDRQQFQEFPNARSPHGVFLDPSVHDRVYHISKYGILRSEDGGLSWKPLTLPTPPGEVDIKVFTINPKNPNMIVYASQTALVVSSDAGATWASRKLPTKREVSWLVFDTTNPQSLFVGTAAAK